MAAPDETLSYIAGGGNGNAANELLEAIYQGYPVEKLKTLLSSPIESAVEAGMWIASELDRERIWYLKDLIVDMLAHPSNGVRFFAIDAILGCAVEPADGRALADCMGRILDEDAAVRWKVMRLLAAVPAERLEWARPHIEHPQVAANIGWLIRTSIGRDKESIRINLTASSSIRRAAAAVAARRVFDGDRTLLLLSANSDDQDVRRFAAHELKLLRE